VSVIRQSGGTDSDSEEYGRPPTIIDIGDRDDSKGKSDGPKSFKKSLSEKPRIVLPSEVVVPVKGLPGKRYELNVRRGHPEKVPHLQQDLVTPTRWGKLLGSAGIVDPNLPQLTKREVEAIRQRQEELDLIWQLNLRDYDRDRANHVLLALCHKVRRLRVAFVNSKGGGATTTVAAWAVSIFGDSTRAPSLTAADFNPANGTLAERLGRNQGETIDLRGVVTHHEEMGEHLEYGNKVAFTRYGVQVVSATAIIKKDSQLTGEDARTALEVLHANNRYLFMDTPNDITTDAALEVFKAADVLVFTANVGVHDSMRQLATSMQTLREQGFVDKVDHSVVCISNIPDGAEVDEYRMYLNELNIRDKIVKQLESQHAGPFMGIPHDPVIDGDSEVNLLEVDPVTYQSFQDLDIEILSAAPQFRGQRQAADIDYDVPRPEREIVRGLRTWIPPKIPD
jgi:cellulose biosynthesis protein BcsQ